MVLALDNARTMIDHGFTSLFSAAGVGYNKIRIEPVLRDVINAGRYPGPRIKAASARDRFLRRARRRAHVAHAPGVGGLHRRRSGRGAQGLPALRA